ncbi:MAG: hypothetical protein P8I02_04060 [Flavobacteriales bacterium]|nr:hypothetical protein [Flavobacteriales bacterium]
MNSKKRTTYLLIFGLIILLVPLIGMQLSSEINWGLLDFIVAGILIIVLILVLELIFRKVQSNKKRLWLVILIGILFFMIWVELSVGIFGSPFAGS